jgi:hypothetical protein
VDKVVYIVGFGRQLITRQSDKEARNMGMYGLSQKGFFDDLMIEPTMQKQEYVLNTNENKSASDLELYHEIHRSRQMTMAVVICISGLYPDKFLDGEGAKPACQPTSWPCRSLGRPVTRPGEAQGLLKS